MDRFHRPSVGVADRIGRHKQDACGVDVDRGPRQPRPAVTVASFHSSALAKLVVDEPGSDEAALRWDGADAVITSRVTHAEVRAALAAAHRNGRFEEADHRGAKAAWDTFRQALQLVEVTHQLEAIHLASALTLAGMPIIMATWDLRLLRAARSAGLGSLPAQR